MVGAVLRKSRRLRVADIDCEWTAWCEPAARRRINQHRGHAVDRHQLFVTAVHIGKGVRQPHRVGMQRPLQHLGGGTGRCIPTRWG